VSNADKPTGNNGYVHGARTRNSRVSKTMAALAQPPTFDKSRYRGVDLSKKKIYTTDFSGCDLSRLKLKHSLFMNCNFDRSDMSETDCEGSEFFGSTFRDTICYRTNFKDAKLAGTLFHPKDAFGMTITLTCKTFEDMKVSKLWWYMWLMFGTLLRPECLLGEQDLRDKLIVCIGAEKYVKLGALMKQREF
jgi:uncharacterized protein YjbI with pentapeptide repeats